MAIEEGEDHPKEAEGARVSTLELFFDLVFVFTLTQLTGILARDANLQGLGRVLVILVVIWWMYGGYAWLTNVVAPDRSAYRLLLLGGMAGFFVVSLAIPNAFEGGGAAFGLAYLVVVIVHAALFTRSEAGASAIAILRVAPLNVVAATLLALGGFIGGNVQYGLWAAAAMLIGAMSIRPISSDFQIEASHFVERHGLVVIVALGESVIAVGIGASGQPLSAGLIGVAVLGLALTACLWWAHFGEGDDHVVRTFAALPERDRPAVALRAFYHWHLLILLGVVALASALEHAIAHPYDELSISRSVAMGGGAALFLVGEVLFRRAVAPGPVLWKVLAAALALATIPLGVGLAALAQVAALFVALAGCLVVEHRSLTTTHNLLQR